VCVCVRVCVCVYVCAHASTNAHRVLHMCLDVHAYTSTTHCSNNCNTCVGNKCVGNTCVGNKCVGNKCVGAFERAHACHACECVHACHMHQLQQCTSRHVCARANMHTIHQRTSIHVCACARACVRAYNTHSVCLCTRIPTASRASATHSSS
jgi:hypothetical protein